MTGDLTKDPIARANRDRILVVGNINENIKEVDAKKAAGFVLPKAGFKLGPVAGKEVLFDVFNPPAATAAAATARGVARP